MQFVIDNTSGRPVYQQIIDQVKRDIALGMILKNDKLPTVRELAAQLVINPNTIAKSYRLNGDPELLAVWEDPDFDPGQRSFYYARVLEIPTPRWTAYDAKYYGIELLEGTRTVQQERAYTSPIWYAP